MGIRHDKDDIYMLHGGVVRNQVGVKGQKNLCVFFLAILPLLPSFYLFYRPFSGGGGLTLQHGYCTEGQYFRRDVSLMSSF